MMARDHIVKQTVKLGPPPPPDTTVARSLISVIVEHQADGMSRFQTMWAGPMANPVDIARVLRQAADMIAPASPIALPGQLNA